MATKHRMVPGQVSVPAGRPRVEANLSLSGSHISIQAISIVLSIAIRALQRIPSFSRADCRYATHPHMGCSNQWLPGAYNMRHSPGVWPGSHPKVISWEPRHLTTSTVHTTTSTSPSLTIAVPLSVGRATTSTTFAISASSLAAFFQAVQLLVVPRALLHSGSDIAPVTVSSLSTPSSSSANSTSSTFISSSNTATSGSSF
ncbi:hypothetical protein N7468_009121 [Penicillium chermesinum]|uniref:Uncharacterized protein n=1 Tax=Penicillium chermesinum TaxID=63820 RepID=A0A9W9TEJ6_9EURO|nr:uncharacterized protein N7468_009121 [Penicillium chermesinum]KAJ5219917.1 hypothetical protein N7468_009121 [Penicillium chermesinum]